MQISITPEVIKPPDLIINLDFLWTTFVFLISTIKYIYFGLIGLWSKKTDLVRDFIMNCIEIAFLKIVWTR